MVCVCKDRLHSVVSVSRFVAVWSLCGVCIRTGHPQWFAVCRSVADWSLCGVCLRTVVCVNL